MQQPDPHCMHEPCRGRPVAGFHRSPESVGLHRPERCRDASGSGSPDLDSSPSDGFVFRVQGGLPGGEHSPAASQLKQQS